MPAVQLVDRAIADATPTVAIAVPSGFKTWASTIAGTGAVSVNLELFGCLDSTAAHPVSLGTMTLSGTNTNQYGIGSITAAWPYMYVKITSITGTGAVVNSYILS